MTDAKISFAEHLNLAPEDERLVREWGVMRDQIDARNRNGFVTHEVTVNGISIRDIGGKRTLLLAQTTVDYTANGKREKYGVNFISNAATLLVVFRVTEEVVTRKETKPIEHYVVMIEQARWGRNDPHCLELPGGLLTENESMDLNNVHGALREFNEETGIKGIDPEHIKLLGKPVNSYPCVSDQQHQFYTEIDISSERFRRIQSMLSGSSSGNAKENESTVVRILPLTEACDRLLDNGNAPDGLQSLIRYMRIANISWPTCAV